MFNLLASSSSCSEGGIAFGIIVVVAIIIGIFTLFCNICAKIATSKNLDLNHRWLGLLGVLGIIVCLYLKPKFVKCRNCNLEYNPLDESCPYCGHDMKKTSNFNQNITE